MSGVETTSDTLDKELESHLTKDLKVEGISVSLEGSLTKIKELFQLKDNLQSEIQRHLRPTSIKISEILDISSRFFLAYGMNEVSRTVWTKLTEELSKAPGKVRPIKLHMQVTKRKKSCMETNMIKIRDFFQDSVVNKSPGNNADTYQILYFLFRFALQKKSELESFVESLQTNPHSDANGDAEKQQKKICDICSNLDDIDIFYGANVCLKCQMFFTLHMRRHALYSLRCHHSISNENSSEDKFAVNVFCRSCRLEKCRQLGMVDEYQYANAKSRHSLCSACSGDLNVRTICGVDLCGNCCIFFDQTSNHCKTMKLLCNSANIYTCKSDPETCFVEIEKVNNGRKLCPACLWSKFEDLGLIDNYMILTCGGSTSLELSSSPEVCSVCLTTCPEEDQHWFGQTVCQICRAFLMTSMKTYSHPLFCCPDGEIDRLCNVPDELGHRCKYCWFRRLELNAIIDRWIVCDGNAADWSSDKLICKKSEKDTIESNSMSEDRNADNDIIVELDSTSGGNSSLEGGHRPTRLHHVSTQVVGISRLVESEGDRSIEEDEEDVEPEQRVPHTDDSLSSMSDSTLLCFEEENYFSD